MKAVLHRVFAHPLTSLGGLGLAVAEVAIKADKAGIHVGHIGNTNPVTLAAGIATLVLGALAKDK